MGITIHYTFVRRNDPEAMLQAIADEAAKLGMMVDAVRGNHLIIRPDLRCEPIDLRWQQWRSIRAGCVEGSAMDEAHAAWVKEIVLQRYAPLVCDDDWICVGFTKTQFAGVDCHCAVAELLRRVASHCRLAHVDDEAGSYEAGAAGYEATKACFDDANEALSRVAALLKEAFGAEPVICGQDLAHSAHSEDAQELKGGGGNDD